MLSGLLCTLLLSLPAALAQAPAPATAPVSAPATALALRLDGARILKDVETLTSPAFGGRRPGTKGHRKAQAFLEARLKEIGLPPLGRNHRVPYATFKGGVNFAVVARGTEQPSSCLLLSAHYDQIGRAHV